MACCISCVSTGEMGIVESMGKFSRIAGPGPNCLFWPFQTMAGKLSTRVQQLNVSTDTKTKDNVTVTLMVAVQYRVINEPIMAEGDAAQPLQIARDGEVTESHGVWRAYYRLTDVSRQLTPYVEDVVRSEVPRKTLDEAYESKEAVALAIKSALQHEMRRYGYEIVNALVTDLQPDRRVQDAMNQIEAQRRMRMASQEKAEADKILAVTAAKAEAEAKKLSGEGVAMQRKAIVEGLKESVLQFNQGVQHTTPADVMQLMMVTQYLDMLKDVGSKDGAKTLFIPHSPAAVGDIQNQMRQGFLEANSAAVNHHPNPVQARSA